MGILALRSLLLGIDTHIHAVRGRDARVNVFLLLRVHDTSFTIASPESLRYEQGNASEDRPCANQSYR